jgi:hypothetical protein
MFEGIQGVTENRMDEGGEHRTVPFHHELVYLYRKPERSADVCREG